MFVSFGANVLIPIRLLFCCDIHAEVAETWRGFRAESQDMSKRKYYSLQVLFGACSQSTMAVVQSYVFQDTNDSMAISFSRHRLGLMD